MKRFRRAADKGDASAQLNLGMLYAQGQSVPSENAKAYFWYNLAAMELGGDAAKRRDEVANQLSIAQVAEQQNKALAWRPKR